MSLSGPSSSPSSSYKANPSNVPYSRKNRVQHKDVVIIGGGLAGLSAALYLSQMDPERHVTILEREDPTTTATSTTAGSFAAAGMLAPQSERLSPGPLLDLCLSSRNMYRDFVEMVESLAAEAGEEGEPYLPDGSDGSVGLMASGGFLAPAFPGDSVATWAPPEGSGEAIWLDADQARELEPYLHPDIVGGWWFPNDASVDARKLTCSLRAACVAAGVHLHTGPAFEVTSLDLEDGRCNGLWLKSGKYLKARSILVANGSWMRTLLPVPVEPHKGQSMSLKMPSDRPPLLRRVLFAQDSYIVPKTDGRIVVGATVEAGSYDPNVTPAGLMHIMKHAIQLVPALADLPIEETWVGLRPTTPDKGPILGKTPWDNLYLAGGYWRNGVLLAPKTGQLVASLISDKYDMTDADKTLLEAFAWDRFISPEGGKIMAANARFAAEMHPVHSRAAGAGVAAAVGTELGLYSTARVAKDERKEDRFALTGDNDDSLERAAMMGIKDSEAFLWDDLGDANDDDSTASFPSIEEASDSVVEKDSVAASASTITGGEDELESLYGSINQNKAFRTVEMDQEPTEEREDPGFRIYHVDEETGEEREVPPYMKPSEVEEMIAKEKEARKGKTLLLGQSNDDKETEKEDKTVFPRSRLEILSDQAAGGEQNAPSSEMKQPEASDPSSGYNEETLDGYTTIQQANSRNSREAELEAMREARMKNRNMGSVDVSKIGVLPPEELQDS